MKFSRTVSVAPMMDWTDRHDRYFLRLLSRHVLLYTEMVTTHALLYGDRKHILRYDATEHPVALQLGGSDPIDLGVCSQIGQEFGYDEINLNVGCPSDRVQSGRFGACLMAEPDLVADCVAEMKVRAPELPITVKHRIGIDDSEGYVFLREFIDKVAAAGCDVFIVHARKAWLKGLSPKENREIPPLDYSMVYQLKRDYPQLNISINGGIMNLDQADQQLAHVDGVMIGRAAYHDPYILADVDQRYFGSTDAVKSRKQIVRDYLPYIEKELSAGTALHHMSRHILGIFSGCTGARAWRRHISETSHKRGAGIEVIERAMALVDED
ncbi:MAG: tRNA dihydrouridine(20/20a) synthase DusA [Gammaproteobacteria bacterium]|nr:tRNA dihydrouridine(20/20a) synthase DusA [Gammaproteobacteria bacterium]